MPLKVHDEKETSHTAVTETQEETHTTTVNYYDVQVVQTVTVSDTETADYDGEELLNNLIETSHAVENDNERNNKDQITPNRGVFDRSRKSSGHRIDNVLAESVSDSYVGDASVETFKPNAEDECTNIMGPGQQEKEYISSASQIKALSVNKCYKNTDKSTQFDDEQSDSESKHHISEFFDQNLDLDEKIQLCTINEFNDLLGNPFENSGITSRKQANSRPRKGRPRKENNETIYNDLVPVKRRRNASQMKRRTRLKNTIKTEKTEAIDDGDACDSEETNEANEIVKSVDSEINEFIDNAIEEAVDSEDRKTEIKESNDTEVEKGALGGVKGRSMRLRSAKGKEKLKLLHANRKNVIKKSYGKTKKTRLRVSIKDEKKDTVPDNDKKRMKLVTKSESDVSDSESIEDAEKNIRIPSMAEFKRMVSIWDREQSVSQGSTEHFVYGGNLRPVEQPEDLDLNFYSAEHGGWYCSNCRLLFKYKIRFMQHRIKTNGKCFHVCDLCDKKFALRNEMMLHRKYHDKDHKPFACHLCDRRYRRQTILNNHIKQHHLNLNAYMCYQCGKQFKIRPCLLNHLKYAHIQDSERVALCSQCPKKFKTVHDLKAHMLTHTSDLAFKCDICQKEFKTRKYMREHRKIHFAERDQICDVCGKGFFKLEHLKNHRKLHTGEKPYSCSLCTYRCTVKCNLDKHMKTHSNGKTGRTLDRKPQKSKKSVDVEFRNVDGVAGLPFKRSEQSLDAEHSSMKTEGIYSHLMDYKNEPYSIPGSHAESPVHSNFTSVLHHDYHNLNIPHMPAMQGPMS